jgi:hypothetical protein
MTEQSDRSPWDPFEPAPQHEELLCGGRQRARADAKCHAEDLLDRQLPFVAEAEALAQRRVSQVEQHRDELVRRARQRRSEAASALLDANQQRQAAEAALSATGVPPAQFALAPLEHPRTVKVSTVTIACTVVGAIVALALMLGSIWIAAAVLACVVLVGSRLAMLASDAEVEHPRVHALRKARARANAQCGSAERMHQLAEDELQTIPQRALSLIYAEQTFAEELVAAYMTELHSSLPPGALADGRALAQQRKPQVRVPAWANAGGM